MIAKKVQTARFAERHLRCALNALNEMPEILRQKLGDDGAQALADVLNKVTVPRVELDSKLDTIINKIDSLRNELKAEIRTECAKVRFQTFAWTFGLFITLLATLYTLLK